jgi:hypothetical protein
MLCESPVSPFHRSSRSITTTVTVPSLQHYVACTNHKLSRYVLPALPVLTHIFLSALFHFIHKTGVFVTLYPLIWYICQCRTDCNFQPEWQQALTLFPFLPILSRH